MARDSSLEVRRAILTAAKADEALTALVPAGSIHPQAPLSTPSWPFIRYGGPTVIPLTGACLDGCEVTVALHGFAKPRVTAAGALLESAEDHAARIGAFIAAALDRMQLTLDSNHKARVRWTGSQLLQDGDEADAFHTVQNFRVRVLA